MAARIRAHLAADREGPAVTVSGGVALYPNDGSAIEPLLGAADRALYGMKHAR